MNEAAKVFNLTARSFPNEMAARGFPYVVPGSSSDNLPGYWYRDDGYRVWFAIESYVSEVLRDFYRPRDGLTSGTISMTT